MNKFESLKCKVNESDVEAMLGNCSLLPDRVSWLDYLGPIATGVAALIAIITLAILITDSRRRSRPYIEARLEVGFWGDGAADLVLQNVGTTPARELSVKCEELNQATTKTAMELKRYFKKNRILRPGERIRLIWHYDLPRGRQEEDGIPIERLNDIPAVSTLNVTYRRQKINGKPTEHVKPYRETFNLDASFKSVSPVMTGLPDIKSSNLESRLHKDMRQGLELIARQISELRR